MALSDAAQKAISKKYRELADLFDPPKVGDGTVSAPQAAPMGATGSWNTIFEDTFTTPLLDLTKWRRGFHWAAAGGHHGAQFDAANRAHSELQWYAPGQASITADNKLQLKAERQRFNPVDPKENGPFSYLSGVVTTAPDTFGVTDKSWQAKPPTFDFLYGWVEAAIRVPKGQGLWPAFWMLRSDLVWPQEIDVMEVVDPQTKRVAQHYHWGPKDQDHDFTKYVGAGFDTGVDLSDDFHTYGVEWQPDSISWYLDGKRVQTYADKTNICNQRMYLLLNLAVGGWAGIPDSTTSFPASMLVDRVSVFQKAS